MLVFLARVIWGLGIQAVVGFKNLFYRVGHKIIQLFAFGWALLGDLEPYAACAASASGRPSWLSGFGFFQHDLSRVHVVSRTIQRAHMWFFIFRFIFVSVLFRGVRGLVWPFPLFWLDRLVAFTRLLVFLFWWFSSPYVWKFSSTVSRRS